MKHTHMIAQLFLLALACRTTIAQTINVSDGQTLSEHNLLAGIFRGQSFTLESTTIFEIEGTGKIGPVGSDPSPTASPSGDEIYFNFNHSTVNIYSGATFDSDRRFGISLLENINLNMYHGSTIGDYIHAGQGVNMSMFGGTVGRSFRAMDGSSIEVFGGRFALGLDIYRGSTVSIHGGQIQQSLFLDHNTTLTIDGGEFSASLSTPYGSHTEIAGGIFQHSLSATGGSTEISNGLFRQRLSGFKNGRFTITGGKFEDDFVAYEQSHFRLFGGIYQGNIIANAGTTIDIIGQAFSIDGIGVAGLTPGEFLTITDRDISLDGILSDGSLFSFDLNSLMIDDSDFFDANSTVRIQINIPSPTPITALAITSLLTTRRKRR